MINNQPSDLRQYLNVLAVQLQPNTQTEIAVVFKNCQLIAMFAADKSKPMPLDVFAHDLDEAVARAMLSALCLITMQTASAQIARQQQQAQSKKIVTSKSRTV